MHTGSWGPRTLLTYRDEIHACWITLQFIIYFPFIFWVWIWLQPLMGWWSWIPLTVLTSFYSQQMTHCSEDFQLENVVHRDQICDLSINFSYKHENMYNASVHSHLKIYFIVSLLFSVYSDKWFALFKVVTSELRHFLTIYLVMWYHKHDIIKDMWFVHPSDGGFPHTRVSTGDHVTSSRPMRKWMLTDWAVAQPL